LPVAALSVWPMCSGKADRGFGQAEL